MSIKIYASQDWVNEQTATKITTPTVAEAGQTIVVKSVDASGRPTEWKATNFPESVTSWNDLADKPFDDVEIEETVIDEEVKFNASGQSSTFTFFPLVVGKKYKVTFDGIEYETIAKEITEDLHGDGSTIVNVRYIGNYEENADEEPFSYSYITLDPQNFAGWFCRSKKSTTVPVKVFKVIETVEPIDIKYLPEQLQIGAETVPPYEVLPETTLSFVEDDGGYVLPQMNLVADNTYTVVYNGTSYECVAKEENVDGITALCLGDIYTLSGGMVGSEATGEPFAILYYGMELMPSVFGMMIDINGATTVTFSITGGGEKVHKLDNKYLDLEWIPAPVEKEKVIFAGNISLDNSGTTDIVLPALFLLTAGNEYKITTSEGVNCKSTAKSVTLTFDSGEQILSWIGNNNLSSYIFSNNGIEVEDTGEAFCYYTLQMSDGSSAYCFTSAERGKRDITVKAIEIAKAKEPIPVEYLPKSVPYVLDGEEGIVEAWPETTYEFEEGSTSLEFLIDEAIYNAIVPNETYIVNWNGTEYECVGADASALGAPVQGAFLGNVGAMTGVADTGEPFVIGVAFLDDGDEPQYVGQIMSADGSTSVTLSVSKGHLAKIQKLDNRCLDLEWLPICDTKTLIDTVTIDATTEVTNSYDGSVTYQGEITLSETPELVGGTQIITEIDGVKYESEIYENDAMPGYYIIIKRGIDPTVGASEATLIGGVYNIGYIAATNTLRLTSTASPGYHTLRIYTEETTKLPEKFLPESIATKAYVEELLGVIENGTY